MKRWYTVTMVGSGGRIRGSLWVKAENKGAARDLASTHRGYGTPATFNRAILLQDCEPYEGAWVLDQH